MIADNERAAWCTDVAALFGSTYDRMIPLWTLLKNYHCHYALEQLLANGNDSEFDMIVAPLGRITLFKTDDGWDIKLKEISPSFLASLNETIRCKESNLYREQREEVVTTLKNRLEKFANGKFDG